VLDVQRSIGGAGTAGTAGFRHQSSYLSVISCPVTPVLTRPVHLWSPFLGRAPGLLETCACHPKLGCATSGSSRGSASVSTPPHGPTPDPPVTGRPVIR